MDYLDKESTLVKHIVQIPSCFFLFINNNFRNNPQNAGRIIGNLSEQEILVYLKVSGDSIFEIVA